MSLAAQLLVLQLAVLVLVLVAVAAVSLAQSAREFREVESRRALRIAEDVAATDAARNGLEQAARLPAGREEATYVESLKARILRTRTQSGASYIVIVGLDRRVVASTDPQDVGRVFTLRGSPSRAWTGTITSSVAAHAPVLSAGQGTVGELAGVAVVGRVYPTVWQRLGDAAPDLLTYLGVGSLLGIAGSLLLSRRVKRQTLGLEPVEIRGLVEHREAMLHGIKEGVIGLDQSERVTLVNEVARELLALPADSEGRTLAELGCDQRLVDVLTGVTAGQDQVVVTGERVLILNRQPIGLRGLTIGSVTTLRDRTELVALQRELGVVRHTTDTLRAQAHEFTNQLHTIAGLIQLSEYDEVVGYITALSQARAQLTDDVTSRIDDPALAALLIAKASLAAERGVRLRLSNACRLGRVDELSADLVTVVGNLVDNAVDATGSTPDGWVEVDIRQDADTVQVIVRDSGPGIAPELTEEVFARGFTTKVAADGGQRGFGLALTRLVCTRRGGDVSVENSGGAVFSARLPIASGR
jgi:sensor histidine kinase regulating citrate/malate metabolism